MKRFSTALRDQARRRMEQLGEADIVVGIPSYNAQDTIGHVVATAAQGLARYYPRMRGLIMVSDGGSVDDTREMAAEVDTSTFEREKIVTIYRGLPGKGSAVRAIFEAALILKSRLVVLLDADLRSITPEWIPNLVEPVLEHGYDFVAPYYARYRLDGTITNTIAYNLTRALFGKRIRQPIGGDFALSRPMVRACVEDEDVWMTDVARFGVDIWLTTMAIVRGFRVVQSYLGVKIHDVKDPAEHLTPMFRQVVGTIFSLMETYEDFWTRIQGSEEVPVLRPYPIAGKPEPFEISVPALLEYFRLGLKNFGPVWRQIVGREAYRQIRQLAALPPEDFHFPPELWVRVVYDFAVAYHEAPRQRLKLVDLMVPLYNARVASLVQELRDLPDEAVEDYFEGQALIFEDMKPYLLRKWKRAKRAAS